VNTDMKPLTETSAMMPYGSPITLELAKAVMLAAEAEALRENWFLVIAIVDSGCNILMLHRMDQAQLGSIVLAQRKAETAVLFRKPTRLLQESLEGEQVQLKTLAMPNALPMEGGIPLVVEGKIVGGIGVSGARSAQDAQVARAGLAVLASPVGSGQHPA
jgi:glc operon protein GlcG